MSVGPQKRRLHPLVAAFCDSDMQLMEVMEQVPCPGDNMVRSIGALIKAHRGELKKSEALRIAEAVPLEDADPDLAILLLCLWSQLLDEPGQALGIQALSRRARDFVGPGTPPKVEAFIKHMETNAVYASGNKKKAVEILRETLRLVPREAKGHQFQVGNLAAVLAYMGRLSELGPEWAEYCAKRQDLASKYEWIQSIETCQAETVKRVLPDIQRSKFKTGQVQTMNALIALSQGERLPEGHDLDEIRPLELLLAGEPEEALAAVQAQPISVLERYHTGSPFLCFNLVRAELGCRHVEAARRLMRIRRDIGNEHPMDDLFLARIELLSGNREAAARHFAAVLRSAEKYCMEPRLDFELRLSCELMPRDLMWLTRAAAGLSTKVVAAPAALGAAPEPLRGVSRLVGNSAAMEKVRRAVVQYAALDAPVMVTGETGTGKEEVANAIHESGPRAREPFVAINCGAIAESLLESELFGHERGAFTGAQRSRKGLFEEAGKGTVLLDEIGEMPARLQVALLRVLESGEIRSVGSNRSRKVACRIIAATNADLDEMAGRETFRQDLLFRLRRLELFIPPLRERKEDILALAHHFLGEGRSDGLNPTLSVELQSALLGRYWPGNIRELRNEMERMRLLGSEKRFYEAGDLRPLTPAAVDRSGAAAVQPAAPRSEVRASGPEARIAEALATSRSPLRRLERLREAFRKSPTLTRQEVIKIMSVSHVTATRDLARLCQEGLIERVEPNASPRSHYFCLRPTPPQAT